jgi:hypothetical protein
VLAALRVLLILWSCMLYIVVTVVPVMRRVCLENARRHNDDIIHSHSMDGTIRTDLYRLPPPSAMRYTPTMLLNFLLPLFFVFSGFYDTKMSYSNQAISSYLLSVPNSSVSLNGKKLCLVFCSSIRNDVP